jgi:hypothetical protein
MYTNQDAEPHRTRAEHACAHASGEATAETCAYLRLLREVRLWVERAEAGHRAGDAARAQLGALWVLQARLSYALDACPNAGPVMEAVPREQGMRRGSDGRLSG